jgi:hypothetical protein
MADLMVFDGLSVVEAMVACGVDHDAIFMDKTQAQRLALDIFGDQFTSCLDITFKELDEHFKTYSDLTVAQGQIRVRPGTRKKSKCLSSGYEISCALAVTRLHRLLPLSLSVTAFAGTRRMRSF